MPRIVFNGRFLGQPQTGVQRYARETLLAFDALLARRPDLRDRLAAQLAVPAGTTAPPLRHVAVCRLPRLRGHAWEQLSLAWFARGAFLVNLNYSGPLAKRRQLVTLHDATVAVSPETFSARYRWVHRALVAVLQRRAALMMTVSDFSRGELRRHFGIRRPLLVGREGWEHAVARGDDAATLQRHGLTPGRYLLAVGSTKPNKNFGILGAALQRLGSAPWTVAVAGACDPRVFQGAALGPSVRALGFVSDTELGHLYRNAAWFVFPSLYEGFGLPAIEAMGNGCPVIAARAASIPEVCGDAALYFDPRDPDSLAAALRRAASEPALREQLLERAQHRLALYSWHANAEILAAALLSVGADATRPDGALWAENA